MFWIRDAAKEPGFEMEKGGRGYSETEGTSVFYSEKPIGLFEKRGALGL
jgi:hypothetical protein